MFSIIQSLTKKAWPPVVLLLAALILSGCAGAGIRVEVSSKEVNNSEPVSLVLVVPSGPGKLKEMESFSVEDWFDKNLVEQKDLGYIIASLAVHPDNLNKSGIYCLNNVDRVGRQSVSSGDPKLFQPGNTYLEIPFEDYAKNLAANSGLFVWARYTRSDQNEVLIGEECDQYCPDDIRQVTPENLERITPFRITLSKTGITINPQL